MTGASISGSRTVSRNLFPPFNMSSVTNDWSRELQVETRKRIRAIRCTGVIEPHIQFLSPKTRGVCEAH